MRIQTERFDGGRLLVNAAYAPLLSENGIATAEDLWRLTGESVKKVLKERGTERVFLRSMEADKELVEAYLKRYRPTPLGERIKAAFSLKFKTYDAFHEWRAMERMHLADVPTVVPIAAGKTSEGTCSLTLGIRNYQRASTLFEGFESTDWPRKRALIQRIAELAGRLHAAGLAHQDFYLVHVFVVGTDESEVFLIDPQRVVIGPPLPERWIVKDLGQLLFSAQNHVSNTDLVRFWRIYARRAGREFRDRNLIDTVLAKAERIARHDEKLRKRTETNQTSVRA